MPVLITGATGFLGRSLIPKLLSKGEEVIALARDIDKAKSLLPKEVRVIQGDILLSECGVIEEMPEISAVYHTAGLVDLGSRRSKEIWQTNVDGTQNVLNFCVKHKVPHLYFISTAYTQGRNCYERSKAQCEALVKESSIPKVTIFKPSIIVADTDELNPSGARGVYYFAFIVAKVHHRVEVLRRWVEGNLRLPVIEPVLRFRGNPEGTLNVIPVNYVAQFIAETEEDGTFWLTHPSPPLLRDIVHGIGEAVLVKLEVMPNFKATPIEVIFGKLIEPFQPYLWGDSELPSSHLDSCPLITQDFIIKTVRRFVLS